MYAPSIMTLTPRHFYPQIEPVLRVAPGEHTKEHGEDDLLEEEENPQIIAQRLRDQREAERINLDQLFHHKDSTVAQDYAGL